MAAREIRPSRIPARDRAPYGPEPETRQPPASRATPPARAGGRHRAATPPPRARRMATGARSIVRHDVRPAARTGYQRGRRAAEFTTVRKGGQHALMAEFLLFLGIVAMRAVADFVPGDQGQPTEGTTKGTVTPHGGQLGPLPILAAGFTMFFVLSFLAARGGTWARVAAAAGLVIDVALLMKSLPELNTVSQGFHNATAASSTPPVIPAEMQQSPIGGPVGPAVFTQVPDATGIFPVIPPGGVPPLGQGQSTNPNVFTKPQTGA